MCAAGEWTGGGCGAGVGALLADAERRGAGEGATFVTVVPGFLCASTSPSAPTAANATRVTSIPFPFASGSWAVPLDLFTRAARCFEPLENPMNANPNATRPDVAQKVTSRT